MSIENVKKFLNDSKDHELVQRYSQKLTNDSENIVMMAEELGYDFTPAELVQVIVDEYVRNLNKQLRKSTGI